MQVRREAEPESGQRRVNRADDADLVIITENLKMSTDKVRKSYKLSARGKNKIRCHFVSFDFTCLSCLLVSPQAGPSLEF